jgi:hypothetical protein
VQRETPIGFFSAVEIGGVGICGGLLLLNDLGRPVEFHCSSPLQPSVLQRVLYGSTLRPYLLGEVIAAALLEKCGVAPAAILINLPELVDLGRQVATPVGLILATEGEGEGTDSLAATRENFGWISFEFHGQRLAVPRDCSARRTELESVLTRFAERLPLSEPFQRIHKAFAEAQASVQREAA